LSWLVKRALIGVYYPLASLTADDLLQIVGEKHQQKQPNRVDVLRLQPGTKERSGTAAKTQVLFFSASPLNIVNMYITLRIQVCPKKWIPPTFLFFSDGIGTFKTLFDREGPGFIG